MALNSKSREFTAAPSSDDETKRTSDIDKIGDLPRGDNGKSLKAGDEGSLSRQTSISAASFALDDSTPVTYHYLTFETLLPDPTSSTSSSTSNPPPPPPDLKKYVNPFDWSASRKNITIIMSCIATAVAAYTAGSYSPPASKMAAEWHVSNVAILVGITTFCIGFAAAPMVLAPFSEINGRYPVFIASGLVFLIGQICCAVTPTYAGMIVSRFVVGCGSSVFSTMVGGVVSDLYHAKARNTPMALFSGAALFGTGIGPLVSGFVTEHTSWRWVFWIQVITCGVLNVGFALFFPETRGSILLSRKAQCLNKWYEERERGGYYGFDMPIQEDAGSNSNSNISLPEDEKQQIPARRTQSQRIRWKVKSDEERASIATMISISVYRPMHLLLTEPVVFFFSLWVAFAWAVLYLTFGSIPLVLSHSHGFDTQQSGAAFAAISIGAAISTVLSIYQDGILARYLAPIQDSNSSSKSTSRWIRNLDLSSPEGRLYFACIESALLPIGLFWFGWTSFSSIPWIVPVMAIACATMGIYSIYLATFNYLADTYHRYASSALAAQSACRNVLGGVFPLVTVQMFTNLGYPAASSLLGGIAVLLTAVPWVLVFYGPTIRKRSKFASEIM
ncbi:MFS multidrug transporter-like protein [Xylogone sp. PMI_703]|nr:MFS multidrug transporter-like protein [Xylogone sp. PMI_703]